MVPRAQSILATIQWWILTAIGTSGGTWRHIEEDGSNRETTSPSVCSCHILTKHIQGWTRYGDYLFQREPLPKIQELQDWSQKCWSCLGCQTPEMLTFQKGGEVGFSIPTLWYGGRRLKRQLLPYWLRDLHCATAYLLWELTVWKRQQADRRENFREKGNWKWPCFGFNLIMLGYIPSLYRSVQP